MKEGDSGILLPGSEKENLAVTPEGSLRISSVTDGKETGWYTCAALSESGSSVARAEVRVAAGNDQPPPIIQIGPVNQTLPIRSTAILPCEATGHNAINWLKDGVPLNTLAFVDTRITVDDDRTLTIKGMNSE